MSTTTDSSIFPTASSIFPTDSSIFPTDPSILQTITFPTDSLPTELKLSSSTDLASQVKVVISNITFNTLVKISTKEHDESVPLRIRKKRKENQFIPDSFLPAFYTSDKQYPQVIIKDAHNVILAIRITLPVEFLNTLCSTNELLPTKGSTSGQ